MIRDRLPAALLAEFAAKAATDGESMPDTAQVWLMATAMVYECRAVIRSLDAAAQIYRTMTPMEQMDAAGTIEASLAATRKLVTTIDCAIAEVQADQPVMFLALHDARRAILTAGQRLRGGEA